MRWQIGAQKSRQRSENNDDQLRAIPSRFPSASCQTAIFMFCRRTMKLLNYRWGKRCSFGEASQKITNEKFV